MLPLSKFQERGQAPLPDLFYFLFYAPEFLNALLGYEIVEGRLDDGRMHELRPVNYGPA